MTCIPAGQGSVRPIHRNKAIHGSDPHRTGLKYVSCPPHAV